jgi:hypothetical protein
VDNLGTGTVDATENWLGCPGGPEAKKCTTVSPVSGTGVSFTPWLTQPIQEEDEKGNQGGDRGNNSEQ